MDRMSKSHENLKNTYKNLKKYKNIRQNPWQNEKMCYYSKGVEKITRKSGTYGKVF
ncbi:hypothetical protein [Clostridium frigidicarnis]|uniref:hypothetical protein n=1 Tax=Clostridium frigidicarnis TaxID=84698 RepID=UPI0015A6C3A9|nr:hypothetical protein [Clostridium frigidicarnis]